MAAGPRLSMVMSSAAVSVIVEPPSSKMHCPLHPTGRELSVAQNMSDSRGHRNSFRPVDGHRTRGIAVLSNGIVSHCAAEARSWSTASTASSRLRLRVLAGMARARSAFLDVRNRSWHETATEVARTTCVAPVATATMSVSAMLTSLGLERFASAFEEEEITEVSLIRSMGPMLLDNLEELGLDAAAQVQSRLQTMPPRHSRAVYLHLSSSRALHRRRPYASTCSVSQQPTTPRLPVALCDDIEIEELTIEDS